MTRPEWLEGRDGAIWAAYIGGATQEVIAAEHGVSRQRVGQVLEAVRETIGESARIDAALLAQERADALLAAVWPTAMGGDTKAVLAALRVLERMAKALGTDAVEPLRVTLERHLDDQGQLLADAIGAAMDAAPGLPHETRVAMLTAAQCALLGEDPPAPAAAVPEPVSEGPDLEADFRRFAAENGFDPDEVDGEDEDDDDTE